MKEPGTKGTHGGRREGAGRKPEGGRKTVRLTVCAKPETVEAIKGRAEKERKTVSGYVLEKLGFKE